jgi:hypothetical protein
MVHKKLNSNSKKRIIQLTRFQILFRRWQISEKEKFLDMKTFKYKNKYIFRPLKVTAFLKLPTFKIEFYKLRSI